MLFNTPPLFTNREYAGILALVRRIADARKRGAVSSRKAPTCTRDVVLAAVSADRKLTVHAVRLWMRDPCNVRLTRTMTASAVLLHQRITQRGN